MIRQTICPMDCPDACALEVEVSEGRVAHIGAGSGHPNTQGFICSKVADFGKRQEHETRLRHPLRRVGPKGEGRFEPIRWDEAIGEIVERFNEIRERAGGEAILPFHYGGSNGKLTDDFLDDLLFARLGASRLGKTICAVPTTLVATGMYGKMPGVAFEDFVHAKFILVWGANPRASNIHLVPYLKEARKRGAFLATVDPRRNFSERDVDLHLPVVPGGDLPLALGMIRWFAENGHLDREFLAAEADGLETLLAAAEVWTLDRAAEASGVPAGDIEKLAATYAASEPALLRCGWGLERNRNGGQAVAAVLAMPALLGKFGVRGGGYTMSNNGATKFDREAVLGRFSWNTRTVNMTRLAAALDPEGDLDPAVEAVFVYNANPVATVPDQNGVVRGFARDDLFTVVFDQVMTDSAKWADIVLPATTFLEGTDLRISYGAYVAGGVVPVVEPVGEARTNMQVFSELGRAFGFDDEAFRLSDEEILRRAAGAIDLAGADLDAARVANGETVPYSFSNGQGATGPVQFSTIRPLTADGRIHLTPPVLGPRPFEWQEPGTVADAGTGAEFPLALITPASGRMVTSTMGEFNVDRLELTIHPRDADSRGISTADDVRVRNDLGEVVCRARVSDSVRPGVVSMPKGAWRRSSANGATSVALCPNHVQVVGGAACFNDARVEVERA